MSDVCTIFSAFCCHVGILEFSGLIHMHFWLPSCEKGCLFNKNRKGFLMYSFFFLSLCSSKESLVDPLEVPHFEL